MYASVVSEIFIAWSSNYVFLLAKSERYYYDGPAIYEPFVNGEYFHRGYDKPGILQRTAARNGRLPESYNGSTFTNGKTAAVKPTVGQTERQEAAGRNKRTVWAIPTCPTHEAHFATFPVDLAEICILAGCPEGGTVLDPFSGAGTTGLACLKHGRKYVGIELNPEYVDLSYRRAERIYPLMVSNQSRVSQKSSDFSLGKESLDAPSRQLESDDCHNVLNVEELVVRPAGFEPATSCSGGKKHQSIVSQDVIEG